MQNIDFNKMADGTVPGIEHVGIHGLILGGLIIEIGCGKSTLAIDKLAAEYDCIAFSIDNDSERIAAVSEHTTNVTFLHGDSIHALKNLNDLDGYPLSLLFIDGGPSAMVSLREYALVERVNGFQEGSIVLLDNASMHGQIVRDGKKLLCRKGRIIVPYLRSNPYWKIYPMPQYGCGMIMAVRMKEPDYGCTLFDADPKEAAEALDYGRLF